MTSKTKQPRGIRNNNPGNIRKGSFTESAGAIGDNGRGVTGINWRSSLMSLKFLGDSNQGLTSDAVSAVNYATMMRTRAEHPENVRVLNASWGQSGGASPALQTAIEAAGQADILFVAAAGNGGKLTL